MLDEVPAHGTSPRLWGDSQTAKSFRPNARYIPTSVGRFMVMAIALGAAAVHPHVCGEISPQMNCCEMAIGTSPRLWGDF